MIGDDEKYPLASEVLNSDAHVYVILTAASDLESIKELQKQFISL